jgi:hypothetical protein
METFESNGDRTLIQFSEAETGVSWSDAELERVFSLDPPAPTR